MRNRQISVFLALFTLIGVSGCDHELVGDGEMVTRQRDLGTIEALEVDIPATVYVRQGSTAPIRMRGEENLIDAIEFVISDNTLRIDEAHGIDLEPTLDLEIWVSLSEWTAVDLKLSNSGAILTERPLEADHIELSLSGSGVIDAELEADYLETEISGSGVVRLAGNADEHDLELSGSGTVAGYNLTTRQTDADVPGSGTARLFVTEHLDISISGTGTVYYKGNPQHVSVDVSGFGDAHSAD